MKLQVNCIPFPHPKWWAAQEDIHCVCILSAGGMARQLTDLFLQKIHTPHGNGMHRRGYGDEEDVNEGCILGLRDGVSCPENPVSF